jgi:very-short-patch-repair endonuclease
LSLLNDYAYAKDLQLLNNTLQAYTEIKERFALEDAASRRLCLALQAESQSCQKFLDALKEPNIDTLNLSYETSVIKQHSKNLSFSKHNGIFFLIWHLFRQKKHDKAVAFFKAAYPQFYTACIEGKSKETIRIAIDNCIGLYTQYRKDIIERQSAWQQVEIQNKDTATEKNGLKQILMQLNKSATGAYLEKRHEDGERITEEEMSSISSLQAKFRNKEELYLLQSSKPTDIAIMKGTFSKFQEICPAWAMSLLSLKYTAPCLPAIFDQVVIDEAAQCDVVSIIPALFRAKRACFMGDTKQLQPILNMSQEQHDYLFCHERLQSLEKFQYLHNSAYQAMPGKSIMLKEHFRCNEDIVNFENDMFYANQLRGRTANKVFHYPSNLGFKRGIEWLDVKNNYEKELLKAVSYVQLLVSNKYEGMVGILSPLRRVVDELKEMLQQKKLDGDTITCNTISSFQGGECDVIIFVLAYNDEIICTRGKAWYITDSSNWYLYNVAISRAKALLLVVGDRERCRNSNIKVLEKLAEYPKTKTISNISRPRFESIWEERFFNVLKNNGITCLTQYEVPSVGRRLDLAYIDTIKIDIEIDGAKFHQDSFGNRKIDDYMRDAQLEACGWQICRFWVSELMEDIEGCAKEVVKRIQKDNSRGLHS